MKKIFFLLAMMCVLVLNVPQKAQAVMQKKHAAQFIVHHGYFYHQYAPDGNFYDVEFVYNPVNGNFSGYNGWTVTSGGVSFDNVNDCIYPNPSTGLVMSGITIVGNGYFDY